MNHHNSDASCARVNEWCCLSLAVVAISQFESADPSTQISRKRVLNNITTTAKVSKICLHVCYTAFDCCYELMSENPIIHFHFILLYVSNLDNWLKIVGLFYLYLTILLWLLSFVILLNLSNRIESFVH